MRYKDKFLAFCVVLFPLVLLMIGYAACLKYVVTVSEGSSYWQGMKAGWKELFEYLPRVHAKWEKDHVG